MNNNLPASELSYAVCINFNSEFSNQLIRINEELTERYGPGTYALNEWWQPHLTLFQGGTDQEGIERLVSLLDKVLQEVDQTTLHFEEFECTAGGLLLLNAQKTEELLNLESKVSEACTTIHQNNPLYRPRAIEKWSKLNERGQELVVQTGSYKTKELFSPHISIAELEGVPAEEILSVAAPLLPLPVSAMVASISLINAGHQNERGEEIRLFR